MKKIIRKWVRTFGQTNLGEFRADALDYFQAQINNEIRAGLCTCPFVNITAL